MLKLSVVPHEARFGGVLEGLLLVGAGSVMLLGASMDVDLFMEHLHAQLLTMVVGRTATRIFYSALGVGFIGGGAMLAMSSGTV